MRIRGCRINVKNGNKCLEKGITCKWHFFNNEGTKSLSQEWSRAKNSPGQLRCHGDTVARRPGQPGAAKGRCGGVGIGGGPVLQRVSDPEKY